MAGKLQGKRIAFLVATEGVEQVELTEPWKAVEEAGGTPELISTEAGEVQAFNHLDKADTFPVDQHGRRTPTPSDYDGLVLPGRRRQPRLPAHGRGRRRLRARVLRAGQAGRRRSATARGRWSRPTSLQGPHDHLVAVAADRHPQRGRHLGRRGGPTSTRASCPRATRTTCRRSAPRSSRSSARASTRARRAASAPPRARPSRSSTSTARSSTRTTTTRSPGTGRSARTAFDAAAVADPPPHRHGRRPAGRRPGRRGRSTREHGDDVRDAEKAALHGADRRGRAARGRARADRRRSSERGHARRARLLGQGRRGRALPRPARRARAGRRLDDLRRRRADEARARPRRSRRSRRPAAATR